MRKLADSIYLENIAEVKTILENEPNLIDEKDEHGVLMALLAAKTGNLELVKYIVEYSRASMNIHDDNNKNMLHYAASREAYLLAGIWLRELECHLCLEILIYRHLLRLLIRIIL